MMLERALIELVGWLVPVLCAGLLGWWAVKRKTLKAWRDRRRARREAFEKMVSSFGEVREDIKDVRASMVSVEAMVRAQSDLSVEGAFECDPDGRNTWVNLTYARMLGVGRADLAGAQWKNYIHPEDASDFLAANLSALAEHRMFQRRCRMVRSDGDVIQADVTIIPFPERPPAKRWFGKIRLVA